MATSKAKLASPAAPAAAAKLANAPVKPSNNNPFFYSPDGTPIRVCLPDGRVAIVGEEPRELPRGFFKEAFKQGCMTTAMPSKAEIDALKPAVGTAHEPLDRVKAITQAIRDAANAAEDAPGYEGAFTGTGMPDIKWLSAKVGFGVDRTERDGAWHVVQQEIEAAEAALQSSDDNAGD